MEKRTMARETPRGWTWEQEEAYRRACRSRLWGLTEPADTADAPLSDDDLAAMEERARAASAGPWHWTEHAVNTDIRARHGTRSRQQYVYLLQGSPRMDQFDREIMQLRWSAVKGSTLINAGPAPVDAAFIAHAREDVPRLIAEIRRLRAERA
jgi:hypothetical protein